MASEPPKHKAEAYRRAGVDLDAGERAVALMKDAVQSTYGPEVLAGLGAFGGLFDAGALKDLAEPVLVASIDGVGTKTRVAAALGRFEGIGEDIVHHCIGDILVQGARPLFFLDYIAAGKLDPEIVAAVVGSAARACRGAGIALLGGETAEMPGVYAEGELDLVGTLVGVVDRATLVDGSGIEAGDKVLALMSGGLQTNGYSLARQVLEGAFHERLGEGTLGDALLLPHRSYLKPVRPLLEARVLRGMAHITGGGIPANLPRILPPGLGAEIDTTAWPVPEVFTLIQRRGGLAQSEMFEVFNMGAGFLLVVAPADVDRVRELAGEVTYTVGTVVDIEGVRLV